MVICSFPNISALCSKNQTLSHRLAECRWLVVCKYCRVALVRYSPEICELSGVINHKTEDFISIIKTAFSIFMSADLSVS